MLRKITIISMGIILVGCGSGSNDNAASMLAGVMSPLNATKNTSATVTTTIATYANDSRFAQLRVSNPLGQSVEFWNATNSDGQIIPEQALYSGVDKIRVFYDVQGMPTRIQNELTGEFVLMNFTDVNAVLQTFDKDGKFIGGYKIEEKDGKYYSAKILGKAFFTGQMTLDLTGGANPASAVLLPDSELVYEEPKELPVNTQRFIQSYATQNAGAKSVISVNAGKSLIKGAFLSAMGGIIYGAALGAAAPLVGTALIAAGVWNVAHGLQDINGTALNYIKDSFSRFEKGEAPADFLQSQTDIIQASANLPLSNFVDGAKRLAGNARDLFNTKLNISDLLPAQALSVVKTSISGIVVDTKGVVVSLKGFISTSGVLTADGSSKDGSNTLTLNGAIDSSFNATGDFVGYMNGSLTGTRNDLGGCQVQQNSGEQGTFVKAHNMNSSSGVSVFFYDAYGIPDQFTVSTFDGIVFGTPGLVSDSGTQNLNIPRNGILVVSVNAPLDDTAWEYNLSCPN